MHSEKTWYQFVPFWRIKSKQNVKLIPVSVRYVKYREYVEYGRPDILLSMKKETFVNIFAS